MKKDAQTEGKSNGLWQKTKYANLVRNASSGKYFARFRYNGKLIWRSLETDGLTDSLGFSTGFSAGDCFTAAACRRTLA